MKDPACAVTEHPLRAEELLDWLADPAHGARDLFLGVVRAEHEGRKVRAVSYDCFKPLAEKTLREIAREAQERFGSRLACAHRVGRLEVGEASVAIAAGSPHRAEAFEACRYVIEEIKRRLPVWKKEHYEDGDSAWLPGCALERAPR